MNHELRQTIAAAIAPSETHAPSGLLVRHFGLANARTLMSEARGAVVKLHKAHRTVSIAVKHWDGSTQSAIRIARSTLLYQGRMRALETILGAMTIKLPSVQKATIKRRKERAAYHRVRHGENYT